MRHAATCIPGDFLQGYVTPDDSGRARKGHTSGSGATEWVGGRGGAGAAADLGLALQVVTQLQPSGAGSASGRKRQKCEEKNEGSGRGGEGLSRVSRGGGGREGAAGGREWRESQDYDENEELGVATAHIIILPRRGGGGECG